MIRVSKHILVQILMVMCALGHIAALLPHHHHYDDSTGVSYFHVSCRGIMADNLDNYCCADCCSCNPDDVTGNLDLGSGGCSGCSQSSTPNCREHNIDIAQVEQQEIKISADLFTVFSDHNSFCSYFAGLALAAELYDLLLFREHNTGIESEPLIDYVSSVRSPRGPDSHIRI